MLWKMWNVEFSMLRIYPSIYLLYLHSCILQTFTATFNKTVGMPVYTTIFCK